MRPLRILVLVDSLAAAGGIERSALELGEALVRRGHEIVLVCGRNGPLRARWNHVARRTFLLPTLVPTKRRPLSSAVAILQALFILWRYQPDVVHIHSWRQVHFWRYVRRVAPPKTHLLLHLRTAYDPKAEQIRDELLHVDTLVAVSKATQESWAEGLALDLDTIAVVLNGIAPVPALDDSEDRTSIREHLGISASEKLILYLGRITIEKGLRELLGAFDSIRAGSSIPLKLVLVGDHARSDVLGSVDDDAVILLDAVIDGYRWIRAADLVVLLSYTEGLPRVVVEALQCGVSVVATSVGGTVEIMTPELTTYLVEPRNVDALAQAMSSTLTEPADPHLLRQVGCRFSVDRVAQEVEQLIHTAKGAAPVEIT